MIKILIFLSTSTLVLLTFFFVESSDNPSYKEPYPLVENKQHDNTRINNLSVGVEIKTEGNRGEMLFLSSIKNEREFDLETCDDLDEFIFQQSSSSSIFYISTPFGRLKNKNVCTSVLDKYISQAITSPSQSAFFLDWIAGDGEAESVDHFLDKSLLALSAYRDNGEIEEKIVAKLRNFYTPEAINAIKTWVANNISKESSTPLIDIMKKYKILQTTEINNQS